MVIVFHGLGHGDSSAMILCMVHCDSDSVLPGFPYQTATLQISSPSGQVTSPAKQPYTETASHSPVQGAVYDAMRAISLQCRGIDSPSDIISHWLGHS